ncbi:MAG: dihydrofolate reductase family protein [Saprospiraceae bacterium]|jgi:dihydrofolate reductase
MKSDRKVILYIASSLDGFIAKQNDDLSFLSIVEKAGEDYGYNDFIDSIDSVLIGRKTYDWVMNHVSVFPHSNKETYVITRQQRPNIGNIQFYTGSLSDLIVKLKAQEGKHIFVDGGAELVSALLKENLIDEFIISIIPVLLGNGVSLFKSDNFEIPLKLVNTKQFDKGLVQLHYKRMPT